MKKKTVVTVIILIGIVAAFAFILENNRKNNQEEVNIVAQRNNDVVVRTVTIEKEDIGGEFSVNGTFQAKTTAQISAELSGQVVALYVEEGSEVKAGQLIARLAGEKLNINVNNAKASLDNATATLSRYESAFETGGITAAQLDQARLQVENAKAQYEFSKLNSGDTEVRAKIRGIVNKKFVEHGTIVNPGMPIVEIVDISSLKLKVEVDESLVSQIQPGDKVNVQPGVMRETLEGRITFIAPSSNGALKFPVEITIDNKDRRLRAGMYGTAIFNNSGLSSVLTIPREAFVGSVSDNHIFVVNDNVAYLKKIQSGINFGTKVEVTDGLKQGDLVVVSGQINLTDSTKVRILK